MRCILSLTSILLLQLSDPRRTTHLFQRETTGIEKEMKNSQAMTKLNLFLVVLNLALIATIIQYIILPWFTPNLAEAMTNEEVCAHLQVEPVHITNVDPQTVIDYCNGVLP